MYAVSEEYKITWKKPVRFMAARSRVLGRSLRLTRTVGIPAENGGFPS